MVAPSNCLRYTLLPTERWLSCKPYALHHHRAQGPSDKSACERKCSLYKSDGIQDIFLASRPDLGYAYKELARFASNPGMVHWKALLSCIGYIKKTRTSHTLCLASGGGTTLTGYSDSDWNGSTDEHLSTTAWITFVGDAPISWCSKTQRCTARSTAESEYVAASSLSQEIIYLQMLVASLDNPTPTVTIFGNNGTKDDPGIIRRFRQYFAENPVQQAFVYTDSANAISNARSPPGWLDESLRHIKTAFHFIKQFVQSGQIKLDHCRGEDNCSDLLSKGFGKGSVKANQCSDIFLHHAKFVLGHR